MPSQAVSHMNCCTASVASIERDKEQGREHEVRHPPEDADDGVDRYGARSKAASARYANSTPASGGRRLFPAVGSWRRPDDHEHHEQREADRHIYQA
jgi:hypothetical protein